MPEKVHVFIDASNAWETQKSKGFLFDFIKLRSHLEKRFNTPNIKVYYYTAYPLQSTREYSLEGKFKFYVFLEKRLGFIVRKKPLKQIHTQSSQFKDGMTEKGNMDVELTIDVIDTLNDYDTAVFFSGDSDFLGLISYIKSKGKKAYVYSSRNNVSSELKTGSDGYTDVLKINDDIWGRALVYRDQKSK